MRPPTCREKLDDAYKDAIRNVGFEPIGFLGYGAHCVTYKARYEGGLAACKVPLLDADDRVQQGIPLFKRVDHLVNEDRVLRTIHGTFGIARQIAFEHRFGLPLTAPLNLFTQRRFRRSVDVMLAMEFIEGRQLGEKETISSPRGRDMFSTCVQCLHDEGFASLDLKPSNVILKEDGGAWLIDLGYAVHRDEVDDAFYRSRVARDLTRVKRMAGREPTQSSP